MVHRYNKAFTLVELITVIVIIGVILSIAFVGLSTIQIESRDQARSVDIQAIANGLEKYYNDNGEYPLASQLNPSNVTTQITDFTAIKAVLTGLTDDDVNGPVNYKFFPYCSHPTSCTNSAGEWTTYHNKQYLYLSTYSGVTNPQTTSIDDGTYGATAWGCSISRSNADPGYALAYRREQDGVWVFYKSLKGTVTISDLNTSDSKACSFTQL